MKYTLVKSELKGIDIPLCVFDHLDEANGNDLKVILYMLQSETSDPLKISSQLNISLAAANSSMLFWADKGLLLCEEEAETASRKKPALTSQVIATLSSDPGVKVLVKNLPLIFGTPLNEKNTNRFLALYLEESIPVDVILQITQHHIGMGVDNPAYIVKVIRSWHTKLGLDSGKAVDEHLALVEKRQKVYEQVCGIFGFDAAKLKSSEKTIIDRWNEKYHMGMDMIEESYRRAGNQASIPYCNGILKAWSQKGYTSPKDLDSVISNITESRRNIDSQSAAPARKIRKVPTLKD